MNKIIKSLIYKNQLSLSVLETTDMVNEAIRIHNLSPVCAAALGRTMTVSTFMASNLKNESDKLTVTVKGNGQGGKITVCGDGFLNMRANIDNPFVNIPLKPNGKLDVSGVVGTEGRITVTKSMGLKKPYSGSCELVTGEIAEDFTAYYAYSEQTPTAIALGVKIGQDLRCVGAGGVIIQALPNVSEDAIVYAEDLMSQFTSVSSLIEKMGAENLVKEFFGDIKYEIYTPKYNCLCSKDYIEKILISLGQKELEDIIKEQGQVKVNCQFCDKEYVFNLDDIRKLFQ